MFSNSEKRKRKRQQNEVSQTKKRSLTQNITTRDHITDFQRKVYAATTLIPRGRVSTYKDIAQILGSSPRAVGQALRNNPFAPTVPCHRVVCKSLDIGGFNGNDSLLFSSKLYSFDPKIYYYSN